MISETDTGEGTNVGGDKIITPSPEIKGISPVGINAMQGRSTAVESILPHGYNPIGEYVEIAGIVPLSEKHVQDALDLEKLIIDKKNELLKNEDFRWFSLGPDSNVGIILRKGLHINPSDLSLYDPMVFHEDPDFQGMKVMALKDPVSESRLIKTVLPSSDIYYKLTDTILGKTHHVLVAIDPNDNVKRVQGVTIGSDGSIIRVQADEVISEIERWINDFDYKPPSLKAQIQQVVNIHGQDNAERILFNRFVMDRHNLPL